MVNERGSLNTEEPFNNIRDSSPSNFQALNNKSDVYMSQPPVITVGGAKTYAATSEMPIDVTDFGNERVVIDNLSVNQKSDASIVKVAPPQLQVPSASHNHEVNVQQIKESSKMTRTSRRHSR